MEMRDKGLILLDGNARKWQHPQGVAMTEFQAQGESWAAMGTWWSWTIGRRRKFTRSKVGSCLKTRLLSSLKSSPHQPSCNLPFAGFFVSIFLSMVSPNEYMPNEDGVQDWSNSNWPGMGPLKKQFCSTWWDVCWVLTFVQCFGVYEMLSHLFSHFILTTILGDE